MSSVEDWEQVQPVGVVIPSLEVRQLPAGAIPLEAVLLIKAMNAEGQIRWYIRTTSGIEPMELGGMASTLDRYAAAMIDTQFEERGDTGDT